MIHPAGSFQQKFVHSACCGCVGCDSVDGTNSRIGFVLNLSFGHPLPVNFLALKPQLFCSQRSSLVVDTFWMVFSSEINISVFGFRIKFI